MTADLHGSTTLKYKSVIRGIFTYDLNPKLIQKCNLVVQRLFGVDKRYEDFEPDVYKILIRLDWRRDSAEALTPLLNAGTKVLAYYGEYDWICNWISGDYMAGNLTWAYQSEFNHQPKRNITIGMSKKYRNFELLTIFGAGHMVPMDQPEVALDMLHNFIGETN